jgi:hypothetical protein
MYNARHLHLHHGLNQMVETEVPNQTEDNNIIQITEKPLGIIPNGFSVFYQ